MILDFLKTRFIVLAKNRYIQHIGIALIIFAWFAALAFFRPLAVPDEGRYIGIAWEMLRSGDYLIPTLNGGPYFHKPPLFYWLTAASLSLFGQNEWAARMVPILGAWLGVFSFYLFMRCWGQARSIFWVLLILCVHPLYYIAAQYANMDMLIAGCITATILLLSHTVLLIENQLPYRYSLACAYVMAGFGFLAKGLIGLVLPAMVIALLLLILRRLNVLFRLIWLPGILLFFCISLPWLIAMQRIFPNFFDYFFVTQHVSRFAKIGFNNELPFWFYIAVLLLSNLFWLPWIWSFFRTKKQNLLTEQAKLCSETVIRLLMIVWIVVIVLFFSIPSSKLLGYILPAVPPFAFLIGVGFSCVPYKSKGSRLFWWGAIFIVMLINISVLFAARLYWPDSTKNLAKFFTKETDQNEPIFMLNHYFFDFPFYAKLTKPVFVVNDWDSAEMKMQTDGQDRELMDTAIFDQKQASNTLIQTKEWASILCQNKKSWVIGRKKKEQYYPFLRFAQPIASEGDIVLWKIDVSHKEMADALHCKEK